MEHGENIKKQSGKYLYNHHSEIISIKTCILITFLIFYLYINSMKVKCVFFIIAFFLHFATTHEHFSMSMFVLSYKHDS